MVAFGLALVVAGAADAKAADAPAPSSAPAVKVEHFDGDPGWEGHNNRIVPDTIKTVHQDFGYSPTSLA